MEIFQLRYFVSAARQLHFSRAAEELYISQPSLSLQIGRLEAELERPPTPDEIKADLKAHPVPRELNLRMHEIET